MNDILPFQMCFKQCLPAQDSTIIRSIYSKVITIEFYFAHIYNIITPFQQQINLSSTLIIFSF